MLDRLQMYQLVSETEIRIYNTFTLRPEQNVHHFESDEENLCIYMASDVTEIWSYL